MAKVYIGLGSNLGCAEGFSHRQSATLHKPEVQLRLGLAALSQHPDIDVLATSSFYASSPVGPQDQPDYVNAAVCVQTLLSAEALLDALQAIETEHGRDRAQEQRWGARTLDLDILLYANQVIETSRLRVPHIELTRRAFVLYPLIEIAPQLQIPEVGCIADVVAKFERSPLAEQQALKSL